MPVCAAPKPLLTLRLDDDLANAEGRGVERSVDASSLREAAHLLLVAPSALAGHEVWLLRIGGHALSALAAERDGDVVTIGALASSHAERLLRAVLGHYALEGAAEARLAEGPAARALGFA